MIRYVNMKYRTRSIKFKFKCESNALRGKIRIKNTWPQKNYTPILTHIEFSEFQKIYFLFQSIFSLPIAFFFLSWSSAHQQQMIYHVE